MDVDAVITRESRPRLTPAARQPRRPLARRPKTLTEDPVLHETSSGGGRGGRVIPRDRSTPTTGREGGVGGSVMTGEAGELRAADSASVTDTEVARRAREIAARLSLARARHGRTATKGAGALQSVNYSGASDEIDVETTLERMVESAQLSVHDIVVRERRQNRRSIVLAVDVSGSMNGERARTAAATIGATVGRLDGDAVGVIAFWSDASVIVPLGEPVMPEKVLDLLLRLPSRGLTNVEFPLRTAASQLERVPSRDARVLLLSDCVHNAGPDPRSIAGQLPRLDVLLDTSGEHDADLAHDLAELGRGRLATATTYRDVAPALSRLFGP